MDDFDDFGHDVFLSITERDIVDAKTVLRQIVLVAMIQFLNLCVVLWRYDWDTVMCISDVVEEHLQ